MKKLIKVLSILFLLIFVISCEIDDTFYVEGGQDGINGTNGVDGKDASIKLTLLPKSLEHSNGAISYESYSGTTLKGTLVVDLPADGHGLASMTQDIKDPVTGIKIGSELLVYSDKNDNGIVDGGDVWQSTLKTYDGKDASIKITQSLPTTGCPKGSIQIDSYTGTVLIGSKSFCLPEDGTNGSNGQAPSVVVTITTQGTKYLWYVDINHNNIYDSGEEIANYLIPKDGFDPIVDITLSWDFTGGNTNSYIYTGWVFGGESGFSDGLLYLSNGSAMTPTFRNNVDLLSLTFKYASVSSRSVKIIAIMQDDSEQTIGKFTMQGISGFADINNYSQYLTYEYYANLTDIQFKNIKRIKIDSSTELKCAPTDFLVKEVIVDLKDNNVN